MRLLYLIVNKTEVQIEKKKGKYGIEKIFTRITV